MGKGNNSASKLSKAVAKAVLKVFQGGSGTKNMKTSAHGRRGHSTDRDSTLADNVHCFFLRDTAKHFRCRLLVLDIMPI